MLRHFLPFILIFASSIGAGGTISGVSSTVGGGQTVVSTGSNLWHGNNYVCTGAGRC